MVEVNDERFISCKNMIYKLALQRWNAMKSKRKDVEFEDVLSEAYWIYSWCLKNWKEGAGSKFTTYLYTQLRGRLADYYKIQAKLMNLYEDITIGDEEESKSVIETVSKEYDLSAELTEFLDDAKEVLSYEALTVLKYLLSWEWKSQSKHKVPSNGILCKHFGYPPDVMGSVMGEIKKFVKQKKVFQVFETTVA